MKTDRQAVRSPFTLAALCAVIAVAGCAGEEFASTTDSDDAGTSAETSSDMGDAELSHDARGGSSTDAPAEKADVDSTDGAAIDAVSPVVDATGPTIDATIPSDDVTAPLLDATAPTVDARAPDLDGAIPIADATTPIVDATSELSNDGGPLLDGGGDAAVDAGATCDQQVTLYHDKDGDGFGATSDHILACAPTSEWVKVAGDCRDDLFQVKPYKEGAQSNPMASGTGYADPTKPGNVSFDFDCDGTESPDFSVYGIEPTCSGLAALGCSGTGYRVAEGGRNGSGISPYCGSTVLITCVVSGLNCISSQPIVTAPLKCH